MVCALDDELAIDTGEKSVAVVCPDLTDVERRIEDWLVCYLDDKDPEDREAGFLELLNSGSLLKQTNQRQRRAASSKRQKPQTRFWSRVSVRRFRSVLVVKILDAFLIRENVIEELADNLRDVEQSGFCRIILNFAAVERMSSQILAVVVDLYRRCIARPEGMLKVCGLRPELAIVFGLAGLAETLPVFSDDGAAIESGWPGSIGSRPLPISILSALTTAARVDGTDGTASLTGERDHNRDGEASDALVELIVAIGPRTGSRIPVPCDRFVIGRDPECQLRAATESLSRRHAAIERRDGQVFVRDLGSTNGTLVNGRVLKADCLPIAHGDLLEVGPLVFTVSIHSGAVPQPGIDDLVLSWITLNDDDAPDEESENETVDTAELDAVGGTLPADLDAIKLPDYQLSYQVIQDVLVVTPTTQHLDDDASAERFRTGLSVLYQRPLPRKVVLNLENVTHLSSRCVGVLFAHFLRLERGGGALRIAQLHVRVLSILEQFRLPMLLELFSTAQEAVITNWD